MTNTTPFLTNLNPREISLSPQIIFEHKDFCVVFKPHGLNTDQDKQGNPSLEAWLAEYYKNKIYLVHRLDRPASGLLLCAKKKSALQFLQQNWNFFSKKYLAIVEGVILEDHNTLEHFHFKDLKNFRALIRNKPITGYKPCSLKWKKLQVSQNTTLLEIELITGRYHQIRAQMAHIGHPILGDIFYGSSTKLYNNLPFIALSAYQLRFYYPNLNNPFEFTFLPEEPFWNLP